MRRAQQERSTRETNIRLHLSVEGGDIAVQTGIGFFDHMLTAFACHGRFGLELQCDGDLQVDGHHTVEDCGIVLGQAIKEIIGNGKGIERFGHSYVPMDEALGFAAVDCCSRAFLQYENPVNSGITGHYDLSLTQEFWRAFVHNASVTLHLKGAGGNGHHVHEALFKAAGRALRDALRQTHEGILSTKGSL